MGNLSGCLTAKLADRTETYEKSLVGEINRNVQPPRQVAADDVCIRAMYIVSDQVNCQGGRFADDELGRLAALLVDSPVMVGHRRDSLPVARNFKAAKVDIDGRTWIKSYFYWMKESEGAEDLKSNIDGGIYKECSVSFLFQIPECSICGRDIRQCRHIPFHEYEVESGRAEIAHFIYRGIEKVLETSLVFRGAIPDTHMTDRLFSTEGAPAAQEKETGDSNTPATGDQSMHERGVRGYSTASISFVPAAGYSPDEGAERFYAVAYQPGLVMRISKRQTLIDLETPQLLPEAIRQRVADLISGLDTASLVGDAVLYASRGKDRRGGMALEQILESETNLHRLRLKMCDLLEVDGVRLSDQTYADRCQRLNDLLGANTAGNIEVSRPRILEVTDKSVCDWSAECDRYLFGLEVIAEAADRTLVRHILTRETLTPAEVKTVTACDRSHVACELSLLGGRSSEVKVICPRTAGVRPGAMLVVAKKGRPGGRGIRWAIVDVLPGCGSLLVTAPRASSEMTAGELYVIPDGRALRLMFRVNADEYRGVVYHFSSHLFARGRRFVADVETNGDGAGCPPDGRRLTVRRITRTGKMIRIMLTGDSPFFGNALGLWLRPALIDGKERYLFYADKGNDLPAGL